MMAATIWPELERLVQVLLVGCTAPVVSHVRIIIINTDLWHSAGLRKMIAVTSLASLCIAGSETAVTKISRLAWLQKSTLT